MKTVWILNHYAQEPSNPGGTRHWSLAHHLAAHGWRGVIIAGSVELNTGRDRLGKGERRRDEVLGGIPFVWLKVPGHRGNGIGRVMNMLSYAARAMLVRPGGGVDPPDAVIGSSVHPFAAFAGWVLARRHRVPFVFEVRDLWPQTLIDLGRISRDGLTARGMRMLERFLYRRADRIIALLPKAWEYIAESGTPADRVEWIPNGVEPGGLPDHAPPRPVGACTFMYLGAHGEANGLDNVLRAMDLAQRDPLSQGIRLRLVGDGPSKRGLVALASELRLRNVSFEDPVPKLKVPTLAAEADAFLFNLVDAPVFRFGISSNKLFDFLSARRPIVFCCDAGNDPVREAGAGITVPPGDPHALLDGMRRVAALGTQDRRALGDSGRRWVEANHSYALLAQRLARMLDSLPGVTR